MYTEISMCYNVAILDYMLNSLLIRHDKRVTLICTQVSGVDLRVGGFFKGGSGALAQEFL